MALLLLVLGQLGCLIGLAATAWAAGWAAWGRWKGERLLHPLTPCLGLALLGETALLLAAVHLFRPLVLALVAGLVHVAAASGWRQLASSWLQALRRSPLRSASTVVLGAAAGAGSFSIALYPPSGFDETTYHLPLARAFLTTGALPWVPELRVPTFPPLGEALQAAMLAAGGERATHLVAVLTVLLTAALLLVWGREALEPAAGWLAAALFLGTPLVVYLGGTGYIDAPLGLFSTAAFYALWRVGRDDTLGWPGLAGAFAGAASAVKYLGLYAVLVGLAVLATRRTGLRMLARFSLVLAATVAVPFGYLLARTGNPVFPFFPGLFGPNDWEPLEATSSLGATLLRVLLLPLNAVVRRDLAGYQPPLSPVLLIGLPLIGWAIARGGPAARGLGQGTAVLLAYVALLVITPAAAHYLLPVVPLWCLLVVAGLLIGWRQLLDGGPTPGAAAALSVALLLPGTLYGAFWLARQGRVPVTAEERETYLTAVHPGYAELAWLERQRGARYVAYVLHGEHLHAFARGRMLGDWSGPWRYDRVLPAMADPAALHRVLRGMGVEYLLLPRRQGTVLHESTAPGRFALLHADADFELWAVAR